MSISRALSSISKRSIPPLRRIEAKSIDSIVDSQSSESSFDDQIFNFRNDSSKSEITDLNVNNEDFKITPNDFKCLFCHNILVVPKLLSCLHTFCKACIEKIVLIDSKLYCPVCNVPNTAKNLKCQNLPTDQTILNLMEHYISTGGQLKCTYCCIEKNKSTIRCFDCCSFFCESCLVKHYGYHKNHRITKINSFDPTINVKYTDSIQYNDFKQFRKLCRNHPSILAESFCLDCNFYLCVGCYSLDCPTQYSLNFHNGHVIVPIQNYFNEMRDKLNFLIATSNEKFCNIKNNIHLQNVSDENSMDYVSKMRSHVDTTFNTITQLLNSSKNQIYQQLINFTNNKIDRNKNSFNSMYALMNRLQIACNYLKRLQYVYPNDLQNLLNFTSKSIDAIYGDIDSVMSNQSNFKNDGMIEPLLKPFTQLKVNLTNHKITRPVKSYENLSNKNSSNSFKSPFNVSNNFKNTNTHEFDNQDDFIALNNTKDLSDMMPSLNLNDSYTDLRQIEGDGNGNVIYPLKSQIKRQKMIYHCKFGEFGVVEGHFTEPSGVAVNANNDIIVADTNNHRIQIFDREGRFKFQFGECGKRDGQLLYPNRVSVIMATGDIVVTERSPTHQIQIYSQYGQFIRKFGANVLQHPRGVTVDNKGRIIIVECKVMRVIIFDQFGSIIYKFNCSSHLEFPNGVVVNDKEEIFISDNRAHCVKVFNYYGAYLRQIGGKGLTNYPIGVGINFQGDIIVADNHNNFNITTFQQNGTLITAFESKVKHAQCFDVALMEDGCVVLASKDYRLYVYNYTQQQKFGYYPKFPRSLGTSICSATPVRTHSDNFNNNYLDGPCNQSNFFSL
ncbi:B-box type zinc finger protein ncl-1 [Intoshia linei]|uniref:B-box type zinc finger protein ncl-1 n=1 Tax=Intoshia linei TaxID=1819745 RepID=A0A177B834_9BILA|nr:B-box type zinc finger protein ncl-1 [Intoshia linei]